MDSIAVLSILFCFSLWFRSQTPTNNLHSTSIFGIKIWFWFSSSLHSSFYCKYERNTQEADKKNENHEEIFSFAIHFPLKKLWAWLIYYSIELCTHISSTHTLEHHLPGEGKVSIDNGIESNVWVMPLDPMTFHIVTSFF